MFSGVTTQMPDSALTEKHTSIYRKIRQGEKERDTETEKKREKERNKGRERERDGERKREKDFRVLFRERYIY